MATGGYKCVSFSWQGGRTDTALGRVTHILDGVCNAIIEANVGWQIDTSLHQTSSDFLTMPSRDSTSYPNYVKVLKKEHNSHTYRLCIGYNYSYLDSTHKMKPEDVCNIYSSSTNQSTGIFCGCLYFTVIKDGTLISDPTYSWVWDGNGLFLKWMPFVTYYSSSNYPDRQSCASANVSGTLYTYYILLKDAQVTFFFRSSEWNLSHGANLKAIVAGEIFKETGHAEDTNTMGSIGLFNASEWDNEKQNSTGLFIWADAGTIRLWNSMSDPVLSQIIASDGTVYSNTLGDTWKCRLWFDTEIVVYPSQIVTSPGGRWTPCYMYIQAADHDTYYVVPGDGFKGYIDTDLLRGVNPNYSYGQQLDGGKFIYIGGGFAIGWDPSNTVPLF